MMLNFQVLLVGSLVASLCAILGCFLVLRKNTMVADAISHAVLPGIVLAFLITGSLHSSFGWIGAAFFGLFATFMIEFLHQKAKIQADAAIGVSFTALFALGIVLISVWAQKVDLDVECVLFGEIDYVSLDLWKIPLQKGAVLNLGARAAWQIGAVLLLVLAFVGLFFKQLQITTFDPAFAKSLGIKVGRWHYLLMALVSLAVVVAFESVGAILVLALLSAPAAAAYLLTTRLRPMLLLAVFFGLMAVWIGHSLAVWWNTSTAGAIATVATVLFFIVLFLTVARKKMAQQQK
ncbi:metal ABC transporter permease [Hugenholtzia roseola]|uniref:metal ABC transporter permease n=1 Tax=Hugenholtzia roseola TaxID=1002 RepID=UPI000415D0B1|nr:metal ABC transporter permease [Hugenholtzia roseola]